MKQYSFHKKKKIADKIHSLDAKINKLELKTIKKIIIDENNNLEFMKNTNGLFAQFNTLTDNTYYLLDNYLKKMQQQNIEKTENNIFQTSLTISDPVQHIQTFPKRKNQFGKKLRLTNAETHILNRARYEKELENNDDTNYCIFKKIE